MSYDAEDMRRIKRFGICLPASAMALFVIVVVQRNLTPNLNIPTHSVPVNNGYNDFVTAGNLSMAMQHPNILDVARGPVPGMAYMSLSAKDAAPALALLHSALDKPCVVPPVRSIKEFDNVPDAGLRDLARTAVGTAVYYEKIGQNSRAADTLLDGYEMGVSIPKGGPLITALVGGAIQRICSGPLDKLLPKLSPADLAHVAKRLERISAKQVPFADVIEEEANSSTAYFLDMMHKSMHESEGQSIQRFKTLATRGPSVRPSVDEIMKGVLYAISDKSAMLRENQRYMHAIAQESRQPYTGPFRTPVPKNMLAEIYFPMFSKCRRRFAQYEAMSAILRMETAAYRYRAARSRFPETLVLLTKEKDPEGAPYLPALPRDPFGGQAIHYSLAPSSKGFLLYSIGDNRIDDHGVPQQQQPSGGTTTDDIVAGKLRTPKRPVPAAPPTIRPFKAKASENESDRARGRLITTGSAPVVYVQPTGDEVRPRRVLCVFKAFVPPKPDAVSSLAERC